MELTIEETAARMGKTLRQVRYMIQLGQVKATKRGGRWFIEQEDAPKSAGQAAAATRKQQRLRAAAEEVLGGERGGKRIYSVSDLRAFQIGEQVLQELRKRPAESLALAIEALRRGLYWLTCGCHRFDNGDKGVAYRKARDEASGAVCELLLSEDPRAKSAATTLETAMLPALAGLLRRTERRTR